MDNHMARSLEDVKNTLEQDGLYVSVMGDDGLWIAADVQLIGTDITFSRDICVLLACGNGQWVAKFTAAPPSTCDIEGSLAELEPRVRDVFRSQRAGHVSLWEAFSNVVGDPNAYLNSGVRDKRGEEKGSGVDSQE